MPVAAVWRSLPARSDKARNGDLRADRPDILVGGIEPGLAGPFGRARGAAQVAVWALALVRVPAGATAVAAGVPAVVPAALVVVWAAAMAAAPGAAAAVAAEVADAAPAAAPLVRAARFSCCPATGPPWSEAGAARGHGGPDLGLGERPAARYGTGERSGDAIWR